MADHSDQESSRPDLRRILITGAAGYLGSLLRGGLSDKFRLRLTDRVELTNPLSSAEEFQRADLEDIRALESMMDGVDTVVHLGGSLALESPWETILSANIAGTYNVFESARRSGIKRVIYASSHHVVGYYRRTTRIGADDPVRPDSRYGVSKAFGEAVGRLYADKYGISVICQRIGVARARPPHRRSLSNWLSERDFVELTRCCLEAQRVHFLIVYDVSGSSASFYDNSGAVSIGFKPQDNADDYRDPVENNSPAESPLESQFQGGAYCEAEFTGNTERIK